MKATVLIVDDERVFRVMAEEALVAEGFEVRTAATLAKARSELSRSTPDVLILDRRLPDGDGVSLLEQVRADPGSGVVAVVVTAYGDVESAVQALRAGAADYLTKPIQLTDLVVKLDRVLAARGLRDQLVLARSNPAHPPLLPGRSHAEVELRRQLESVSASPLTPVMLVGPSGAGKQCAAELLHAMTYRSEDASFVEVNCAALPQDLVESELFGHERGAFTDARAKRRGLAELANGGTLFLDEVTELPLHSQAKLLKFLDTMRFRRVGGDRELEVRLRVVAATNQDITRLAADGLFRQDLYHRLGVLTVRIPALQERRDDVLPLAESFVRFFADRLNKRISGIGDRARRKLQAYDYPGNVRELRNVIERAVILARGAEIEEGDIVVPSVGGSVPCPPGGFFSVELDASGAPPTLEAMEQAYVLRVLEHAEGRRMQAAQMLGISYPTFLKQLRRNADDT
jgi:DNA-binding NtrC family response regulator